MAIAENCGSGCAMTNLRSPSSEERGLGGGKGEGDAVPARDVEPGEDLSFVVSSDARSDMAPHSCNGVSEEIPDVADTVQKVEMRLRNALQHMSEAVEVKLLDALEQAGKDIIDHLGREAAMHIVAAKRKAAVLEQELKNTRSEALNMLLRLRYAATQQGALGERMYGIERRRAQEAEAKLHSAQETIKRMKVELKRKSDMVEELQKRVQPEDGDCVKTSMPASASEGLDRRKRGGRARASTSTAIAAQDMQDKQLLEQIADQPSKQAGILMTTADSNALRDADVQPWKRRKWEGNGIGSEQESRVRSKSTVPIFHAPDKADQVRDGHFDMDVEASGSWMKRGITQAGTSCLGGQATKDLGLRALRDDLSTCGDTRPVDPHKTGVGDSSNLAQDESILECREPGINYHGEKFGISNNGGPQATSQAARQQYSNLLCSEQDDEGYGNVLVNDGEADRPEWRATSPLLRQAGEHGAANIITGGKVMKTVVAESEAGQVSGEILLANVAEQELENRAATKPLAVKRKRREKVTPPSDRGDSRPSAAAAATDAQATGSILSESSRDSRRLMQGARQLFSLRRGAHAE